MTDKPELKDPALIAAEIDKLSAEALFFKAQADLMKTQQKKENSIAIQHEFAADEAKRAHEIIKNSNEQNRIYDYVGVVNTSSTEQAMQTLSRWKRQSGDPITIRITSPGGSVIDGLALFDYISGIKASGIEVKVIVLGVAASMAGVLLQAASDGLRVVGPNSRFLIHEIAGGSIGKLSDMEDETRLYKSLNMQLYGILSRKSKMTVKEIEVKARRKDWWLDATEVVEAGFADRMGTE